MPSHNLVVLIGNLTKDPLLQYTKDSKPWCSVGLAVNERRKDAERVDFFDCSFFGRNAEVLAEYCKKGSNILVQGRIHKDKWTGKDGQQRDGVTVVVDNMTMLGKKEEAPAAEGWGAN